jgi:hypothetical protein
VTGGFAVLDSSGHDDLDRWDAFTCGELSATGVPGDTFTLRLSAGFTVIVAGVDGSAIVRRAADMNLAVVIRVAAVDSPVAASDGPASTAAWTRPGIEGLGASTGRQCRTHRVGGAR